MAELLHAIISGAIAGLILAVLVGPVFFALLQTSIEKGFLIGLLFALGIILSDATFFLVAYFGISQLGNTATLHNIMGSFGGLFLLIFGLRLFTKKPKLASERQADEKSSLIKSFIRGFFINAMNPSVLLYWIGVVSAVSAQYEGNPKKIFAFFMTSMSVVFSTDTLKSFLAYKLKNVITYKFMLWLNRFSGSILMLAGAKLIWDVVHYYLTNKV